VVTRIHDDCTALVRQISAPGPVVVGSWVWSSSPQDASTTSSPASTATTMNPIFSILRRSQGPRPPEATTSTQMPSLHRDRRSNAVNSFPRPTRPQVFFGRDDELNTIIDLIFYPPPQHALLSYVPAALERPSSPTPSSLTRGSCIASATPATLSRASRSRRGTR
jgi:hypothetical protein